ncbi:MAG: type IV pilus twitching motility protein PilT [Verrucomicrobiales bacterium]
MATPLHDLLRLVIEEDGSDLHLTVNSPPVIRVRGLLVKLQLNVLSAEDTANYALELAGEARLEQMMAEGGLDFSFTFQEQARFRVSVYLQRGTYALALRLIPVQLRTMEEIGLPPAAHDLIHLPRGLFLVVGPTGSGKTTTLAAMLDRINKTTSSHLMTIEDPIEYHHSVAQGVVNQREVGVDVPSFAEALRRALRQDPDVILVGEMRDLETIQIAITAAETGHLVFSTVHTTGAGRTVDRLIDVFPKDQQEMIRVQLASNLKAVLSQVLLPRADSIGRVAAFELMITTPSVSTLIRDNKSYRISSDIQTGSKYGMVSLESSLVDLHLRGLITYEQIRAKASDMSLVDELLALPKAQKK